MAHNFRTKEETARHNRRLRRQLLGAVLTVLMVVGLVTVVSAGVQGVAALFDDTEEKEEFAARLNTLVMLDPVPFGTLDQADPQVLKTAAVWASLATAKENGSLDLYEHDPDDMSPYMPAVDVDAAAAALYSHDYKIQHGTLQDDNLTFYYDETRKAYKIPVTGQSGMYYPVVEKLQTRNGILRVTVGYMPTYTTDEFGLPTSSEPEKYMDYLFEKKNGEWYLAGLEESEMKAAASSSSAPASAAAGPAGESHQQLLQQQTGSAPTSSSASAPAADTAPTTDSAPAADTGSSDTASTDAANSAAAEG